MRHKNERNFDKCYNMDEPWQYCDKWNKPDIKCPNTVWFHLNEVSALSKFTDRKVDYRWAGAGGRGEWAVITEWVQFPFGVIEKFCK